MLQVDLTTCSAYIGEECEYSGDRLGEIHISILLFSISFHVCSKVELKYDPNDVFLIEVQMLVVDYEPPVGGVSSIERCQMWAEPLEPFGAHYFYFDGTTEECMLFSTLQADCRVIGGPKTAPHLTECP